MQVTGPKGPRPHAPAGLAEWARGQLLLAAEIVDNPGGGLLFATQAIGQVRVALADEGSRWTHVVELLGRAEECTVRRDFAQTRRIIDEALVSLA